MTVNKRGIWDGCRDEQFRKQEKSKRELDRLMARSYEVALESTVGRGQRQKHVSLCLASLQSASQNYPGNAISLTATMIENPSLVLSTMN